MDPKHTGEMLRHLEKQSEFLTDAYNSLSNELHKLQVEEEMLMRKFYELMQTQGFTKKNKDGGQDVQGDMENGHDNSLVVVPPNQ